MKRFFSNCNYSHSKNFKQIEGYTELSQCKNAYKLTAVYSTCLRRMFTVIKTKLKKQIQNGSVNLCFSFTMKRGNEICADPTQQWVKDIIEAKDRMQTKRGTTATTGASEWPSICVHLCLKMPWAKQKSCRALSIALSKFIQNIFFADYRTMHDRISTTTFSSLYFPF